MISYVFKHVEFEMHTIQVKAIGYMSPELKRGVQTRDADLKWKS